MMLRLAHSGFATLTGEGDKIQLTVETVEASVEASLQQQRYIPSGFEPFVETVDDLGGVHEELHDLSSTSTPGVGSLYTSTGNPQTHIAQGIEPVEADLYSPLQPSTRLCCALDTPKRLPLRVGDICRYVGPEGVLGVTCRGRDLQVLEVKGSLATVNALKDFFHHHEWIHPYDIEIGCLRKKS